MNTIKLFAEKHVDFLQKGVTIKERSILREVKRQGVRELEQFRTNKGKQAARWPKASGGHDETTSYF